MHLSEKEKTVLEIEAQQILNYFNVPYVIAASILLTLWLTTGIVIQKLTWKIMVSLLIFMISMLFIILLKQELMRIKIKIRSL